jgi:hypothetical protein
MFPNNGKMAFVFDLVLCVGWDKFYAIAKKHPFPKKKKEEDRICPPNLGRLVSHLGSFKVHGIH